MWPTGLPPRPLWPVSQRRPGNRDRSVSACSSGLGGDGGHRKARNLQGGQQWPGQYCLPCGSNTGNSVLMWVGLGYDPISLRMRGHRRKLVGLSCTGTGQSCQARMSWPLCRALDQSPLRSASDGTREGAGQKTQHNFPLLISVQSAKRTEQASLPCFLGLVSARG